MDKEYTLSKFYKIFYSLLVALMFGFALFSLYKLPIQENPAQRKTDVIFSTILLLGAAILSAYVIRRKVIVSKSMVTVRGMFNTKQLPAQNIKGFRVADKSVFVETTGKHFSRLRINDYAALGDVSDMIAEFNAHYADLDAVERQEELNLVLKDDALGYSEDERNQQLASAKRTALIYNIAGYALFFGAFLRNYYYYVALISFFYPLIGIWLIVTSKGLIKFFAKKNSPFPRLYSGMYVPGMMLMVITIMDYHLISHDGIWLPFLTISLIVFAFIAFKGIVKTGKAGQVTMPAVVSLFYGYGSAMFINCGFDKSKPQTFTAIVNQRYKTNDVPYIRISDWGMYKEFGEIKVVNAVYNQLQVGSTVKVQLKKGVLNIPWYYVDL